jgi:hypothetical protein
LLSTQEGFDLKNKGRDNTHLPDIAQENFSDFLGATQTIRKNLAATYSRGIYKTTTIGKTVFDGRVRNGNGSGHSFMATKKLLKNGWFSEDCTQELTGNYYMFASWNRIL